MIRSDFCLDTFIQSELNYKFVLRTSCVTLNISCSIAAISMNQLNFLKKKSKINSTQ